MDAIVIFSLGFVAALVLAGLILGVVIMVKLSRKSKEHAQGLIDVWNTFDGMHREKDEFLKELHVRIDEESANAHKRADEVEDNLSKCIDETRSYVDGRFDKTANTFRIDIGQLWEHIQLIEKELNIELKSKKSK